VVHDDTGRALRLPHLAPGQSYDEKKEAFILRREDADTFSLTWRDGSRDTFVRGADGCLPHGYDGVNAMLDAGAPLRTERFILARSAGRDGRGISVALMADALPGELLLRVTSDDGVVLEAMRDAGALPCIGRVEEVLEDGTRVCHVRYAYAFEDDAESPDLVSQTDVLGHSRTYSYHHHLLTACTSYGGFTQTLAWVSLAALRARWSGNASDADYPIMCDTSYQARAIASRAADGSEGAGIAIEYLDMDTTRVSENGDVLDYTFDSNWLVTSVSRVKDGVSTPLGRREWDRNGLLLADTDSLGHTTRFTYDAAANLTSSTDAAGYTTRIAYDGDNHPVCITDPLGQVTQRTFDADGRLASVTNALGHTTSFRYDDKGQLVEQVDAKGGVSRFEYDKVGPLRTSTDCSGRATKYHYDERGRVAAVINADAAPGEQTRYTYDALGRLVKLTRPDGTADSYTWDAEDNLLVHTDAMGHQTRYRYNGQGLLIERTDAIGQHVRYRYDTALRLVELTNANDEPYLLTYDVDGALTSETGFDGKVTRYIYDKAGQLTASECAGQRTDLVRDTRGLLVAKMNADGIVRFAYDELGRMVAVAAPQAEHRFAYDPLGQLIEERAAYYLVTSPVVPPVDGSRVPDAAFMMTHAYDELGNRIRTTLPNGRRVDTLRYGSGHWHGTQWQGVSIVDIERDGRHRERKRYRGRGAAGERMIATREYDPQSRVRRMRLARAGDGPHARPLRDRVFDYDPVGNLLTIAYGGHAHDDPQGTFRYAYDPVGQLMSATQPGLTETFVFDPAGNLLDAGRRSAAASPPAASSRLPAVTANLLKTMHGHSYQYDAQGNVIAKHSAAGASGLGSPESDLTLEYDADNRLCRSVRTEDQLRHTAEYFYDAFSRRVAKRVVLERRQPAQQSGRDVPDSATTVTTLFVWDGDVLAQELSPDDTVTYLYEPDSFVPMVRVASRSGYGSLADEHAEKAEQGRVAVVPEYKSRANTPSQVVHLFRVQHWKLNGSHHAQTPELTELANADDVNSGDVERENRQKNADVDAHADRIDYYNCDHIGSPRELANETGQIEWIARFAAWGRTLNSGRYAAINGIGQGLAQPLGFQGQYDDVETGLSYNRYRYYDPDAGRFLTQDPIGLLGGLNSYAYAPNPLGWSDPLGLKTACPVAPTCDPCAGKNPAAWARQWQGHGDYKGRDDWKNIVLEEDTEIYGGAPGQSGFYFSGDTINKSGLSKTKLWQSVQVLKNRRFGYRPAVQKYRVKKDTCVAVSIAQAQKSTSTLTFGSGGGIQYFLPDFKSKLELVGSHITLY
jgi:RHS repeat-associated protein